MLQVFFKGVIDGALGKVGARIFFAEVNSKVCRHVFECVCVFRRTCCVYKCFQRRGAPAFFLLWIIHRA